VRLRIEDGHVVGGVLRISEERPVGVHGREAAIGRDEIVQVALRLALRPPRDDDVALQAPRTMRLRVRELPLRHAIGPVGEVLERRAAQRARERRHHGLPRLAGLDAPDPRLVALLDVGECGGQRPRGSLSWWQPTQPRFPMRLTQSSRLMFFGIFEVPPNSVASGIFNIEYQWMAG